MSSETPLVVTSHGIIGGSRDGNVCAFLGVRYAAPPVGGWRWRPPRPPASWSGVRPAAAFAPMAPQVVSLAQRGRPGFAMEEDCLALNIWTPAADEAKRPVLVFVHGGGFTSGSGGGRVTHGAVLAARGVVVVTINYRLGALGSLYAPERLGPATTNLGLQDIAAAFAWVRDEIGAFGGDPANVTAIGFSSGAVAMSCLLTSPRWQGLYDRMILQSGGLDRIASPEEACRTAARFFAAMPPVPDDALRGLPLEMILNAQARVLEDRQMVPPLGEFHPTIDGTAPTRHPLALAEAGGSAAVPLLIGSTTDEWHAFEAAMPDDLFDEPMLRERVRLLLGGEADADDILSAYRAAFRARGQALSARRLAAVLVGDFHFRAPSERLASAHAANGNPTFHYSLEWPSPNDRQGAAHGDCLSLLFGTGLDRASPAPDDIAADAMSRQLQDAWIAFARDGDPSTAELGAWQRYRPAERATMTLASKPELTYDRYRSQYALWQEQAVVSG